ncbi:MAG: NifU family protein [Lewinellaceae bacterium]|nr:NifU family protein [Phaeodactylibacter sp.]MCB0612235.1 NifU family protein [Phaeodactylibacter sp.]MCB9351819.1 NifU family protein [Lewinellaceae bacterium]
MSNKEKQGLLERVDEALNAVRPHLAVDGGNVEVVEVTEDKVVKIKWLGTCENCSMTLMTMKAGIEQAIMGRIPEIIGVEAVNGLEV